VAKDYGGFATVTAQRGASTASFRLPKDANANWLPDAGWKATANGQVIGTIVDSGLATSSDEDNEPSVTTPPAGGLTGDGLTNFEEFRGFVVRGEHRRTNPFQKDMFISSNLSTGIAFAYPNLPTTTHRVYGIDEPQTVEYRLPDRVINFNYQNLGGGGNIPGHYDQKALRMIAIEIAPFQGLYGAHFPGVPGSPNETEHVEVYLDTHAALSGPPYSFMSAQIVNEISRTAGHEVGHGLHICHRTASNMACPDGAQVGLFGSADSVMSSDVQGTPASDPRSQYNVFDANQIRLHVR
jgi:hypothetical protein